MWKLNAFLNNKQNNRKTQQTRSWFFEKINKTDKILGKLTKKNTTPNPEIIKIKIKQWILLQTL